MGRAKVQSMIDVPTSEAVGYIRVSTQDQANSGLGLDVQRARIEAYCIAQGWTLVAVHVDAGVSAKTLDRPALTTAIDSLCPGRVLLGLKLDRLTRTARDLDVLTDRVHAQGGEWATVEGNYDTSNAMGRFMIRIIADIAQMEREVTVERTVAALSAKRTRGERLGTTALGFNTVNGHVQINADEQETVRIARELRASGMTLRAIADKLTELGRQTKRGGRWQAQTVSLILSERYLETIS